MANRYWVGGTSTWDGTAGTKWATTSGGAGGAAEPTAADDVFFDANSGNVTVTVSTSTRPARNITFTGFTGTFAGSVGLTCAGSLTLSSGMVWSHTAAITFTSTSGISTLTGAGKTLQNNLTFNGAGGTWQLQDDVTTTKVITLTTGTIDLNGKNFLGANVSSNNSNTRAIIWNGGNLKLTSAAALTVWDFTTATGATFDFSLGGTIEINGTGANVRTFMGGGKSYPALLFTNPTASATLTIGDGGNTFLNLIMQNGVAQTLNFIAATTTTFAAFTVKGASGALITITSTTAANHTLAKSGGGAISTDFLSISRSTATPSSGTWYAGAGSTNGTGNTGWIFTALPTTYFRDVKDVLTPRAETAVLLNRTANFRRF